MDNRQVRSLHISFDKRWNSWIKIISIFVSTGHLGEVLIRCNNVLYISGASDDDEEGEMRD